MNRTKKLIMAGMIGGTLLVVGKPVLAWDSWGHPGFSGAVRRDIRRDRIDLFRDRRDLRGDVFRLRRDLRRGASPVQITHDRRDIVKDRRDIFFDRRDLRMDFAEFHRAGDGFFWRGW